ncbi:MOSC domain-containing protein [Fodinibacter luteus]|uniref:MOSC domain-containing protein n=1 Tax=Fodinibacter luteus TaxID=552064 RepID=A0ABP8KKZ6_9MICO
MGTWTGTTAEADDTASASGVGDMATASRVGDVTASGVSTVWSVREAPGATHRTADELAAVLPMLLAAPRDAGTLELVVRRPRVGHREVLHEGELDVVLGLVGDSWSQRPSSRTADGGPHPDMQLNVMSAPLVGFLAGAPGRRALAGDQLYLDLDLSHDNLPAGSRLTIGDPALRFAVIEVTAQPHTGCAKFVERFGAEAMRFVNGAVGRPLRLRGLNARVVVPGRVRPGDPVTVTRRGAVDE